MCLGWWNGCSFCPASVSQPGFLAAAVGSSSRGSRPIVDVWLSVVFSLGFCRELHIFSLLTRAKRALRTALACSHSLHSTARSAPIRSRGLSFPVCGKGERRVRLEIAGIIAGSVAVFFCRFCQQSYSRLGVDRVAARIFQASDGYPVAVYRSGTLAVFAGSVAAGEAGG